MNRVFVDVSYEVFNMPGFFTELYKFIGTFQLEQSIQQSLDKCFRIWFYTDKIEINEGELRQVNITVLNKENNELEFKIEKY
jgi:hypothetical protein